MEEDVRDWNLFTRYLTFLSVFIIALMAIGYIYQALLFSICCALILSYVIAPIEKLYSRTLPFSKKWTTILSVASCLALVVVGLSIIIPFLIVEIQKIIISFPQMLSDLVSLFGPVFDWGIKKGFITQEELNELLAGGTVLNNTISAVTRAVRGAWSSTPKILGGAVNFALIPVFMFFFMSEKEKLKFTLLAVAPKDITPLLTESWSSVDSVLRAVVKGQLWVASILGLLYMIFFSLISLPSALAIGLVAGCCRIVPYFDILMALLLGTAAILAGGGGGYDILVLGAVITFVQAIDGMFITPRVVGDRVGLHPILVIASVIAFGSQLGILGVIMAIPIVATVSVFISFGFSYYLESPYYKEGDK